MSELSYKELQKQGVFDVPYRAFEFMQEQQKKKDLAISKIKAFEKNTSADQVLLLNDLLIELKGMLK